MVVATAEIDGRSIDGTRLAEVCRRFGIAELAVVGSVVLGEAEHDSDVGRRSTPLESGLRLNSYRGRIVAWL